MNQTKRILALALALVFAFASFTTLIAAAAEVVANPTKGDVNKNGKIDMTDYILTKRAYFETYKLSEEQLVLADINCNDKLDMTDYILLKRIYFGTFPIPEMPVVPSTPDEENPDEDTSSDVSEDTSSDVSEDTSSDVSEDTSSDVSDDTSSDEEPELGSYDNPYIVNITDRVVPVYVPANGEVYVKAGSVNGTFLNVGYATGSNYVIYYGRMPVSPTGDDNVASVEMQSYQDFVVVMNTSETDDVVLYFNLTEGTATDNGGTMDNPFTAVLGDNIANVAAGTQGVFYTYTAEQDGTLVITMPSDMDWTYFVNNLTSYAYGDTQWSDSDPVLYSYEVEVAAGDELQIMVNTYNPADEWNAPAGEITWTLNFKDDRENLALGKTYTYSSNDLWLQSWCQTGTNPYVALTNGAKGSVNYYTAEYVGWNTPDHAAIEIVVDLNCIASVSKFTLSTMAGTMGIACPNDIAISVSKDNAEWTPVTTTVENIDTLLTSGWNDPNLTNRLSVLTADEAIEARYVKFTVTPNGLFIWAEEIEVMGIVIEELAPATPDEEEPVVPTPDEEEPVVPTPDEEEPVVPTPDEVTPESTVVSVGAAYTSSTTNYYTIDGQAISSNAAAALTDGAKASPDFWKATHVGFQGLTWQTGVEITLDLGASYNLTAFKAYCEGGIWGISVPEVGATLASISVYDEATSSWVAVDATVVGNVSDVTSSWGDTVKVEEIVFTVNGDPVVASQVKITLSAWGAYLILDEIEAIGYAAN